MFMLTRDFWSLEFYSHFFLIFLILPSFLILAAVKVELTLTLTVAAGLFFPSFLAAFCKRMKFGFERHHNES